MKKPIFSEGQRVFVYDWNTYPKRVRMVYVESATRHEGEIFYRLLDWRGWWRAEYPQKLVSHTEQGAVVNYSLSYLFR